MENKEINGSVSVSENVNIGGDVLAQGDVHLKGSLKVDGELEAENIKGLNNKFAKIFLGYHYGVSSVLREIDTPQPGMFFVNGETNSVWMCDALTRMWIDTNRVDSGMKGMLNDDKGNSPSDFVPSQESGIKESYFYVAECDDCDLNPNAKPMDITFTYFKNGSNSVSVTVRKTSIVSLFWNGTYWETSVVPMNIDLDRLFKGILYAYLTDGKYRLYTKYDSKNPAGNEEFTSNSIGGEIGSVWRVKGDAGGILISNYGTLGLITSRNMYLFEYSNDKGEELESSSDDYKNGKGYWRKVTKCENLTPNDRTKWNKAVTDLDAEIKNRKDAIAELTAKAFDATVYIDTANNANILYREYDSNTKKFSSELGYQTNGKVFKVTNMDSFSGIGITISGAILVLSAKRNLYFTYNNSDSHYVFNAEYKPVDSDNLFNGTLYFNAVGGSYKIYEDAGYNNELKKRLTVGDVYKAKGGLGGIAVVSYNSKILVIAPNFNIRFNYNSNDNNEYEYTEEAKLYSITADDRTNWNKAVTDLTNVKNDISDLKQNQGSAASVKYATSVSVPRGGFVFADGASFLAGKNEVWLSSAMKELGLKYKSVAVGGQSIKDTAYRLCMGNEDYSESLEKMDVFLIDHVHNQDVFTLSRERSIEEYEEIIRNLNIDDNGKVSDYSISYAEAFDYVIKKHMANCYNLKDNERSKWYGIKSGKPVQMLLCTHWHDARTTYNESVRKLCAKWGIALCEMDINIGFAKTGTHPVAVYNGEPAQISLFYAQNGKTGSGLGALEDSDIDKQVTPHIYGLHQYLGKENHNFLTYKMASILMRCFVVSNVIEWSSSFNMNDYKTQGVYYINGVRLSSERDNLPILNAASGHSISGEFTVLDASLSEEEMCVTQYLKLSNRLGREGKEYIRTYNRFKDGREEWSLWRELKGTLNLNQISDEQLKSYTENGCYEGVIVNSTDVAYVSREYEEFNASNEVNELRTIPTACLFTMEVQNNYAVIEKFSEMIGDAVPHTIVQRVKFVAVSSNAVEVKRVCTDGIWGNWKIINI